MSKRNIKDGKDKSLDVSTCICGERDCIAVVDRWLKAQDGKRCGFYVVPDEATDASFFGGKMRDNIFAYFIPDFRMSNMNQRVSLLSSNTVKYVAYHHFNPIVLKDENLGPIVLLDEDFARKYKLDIPQNKIEIGKNSGKYVTVPNYPTSKMFMDLESKEDKIARTSINRSWALRKVLNEPEECPKHLSDCILNYQFDLAYQRCLHYPHEASEWLEHSSTKTGKVIYRKLPLHNACLFGAPKSLLLSLIEAYPDAVKKKDDRGKLPIHIIINQHVSLDVVQKMLRTYPESANIPDKNGMLPIHHASACGASDSVINALFLAHPTSVLRKDRRGRRSNQFLSRKSNRNGIVFSEGVVNNDSEETPPKAPKTLDISSKPEENGSNSITIDTDIEYPDEPHVFIVETQSGVRYIRKKSKAEADTSKNDEEAQWKINVEDGVQIISKTKAIIETKEEKLAAEFYRKEEYERALFYFESAIENERKYNVINNDRFIKLKNNIANCLVKQGKFHEASECLKEAIIVSNNDVELRVDETYTLFYNKGYLHLHEKEYEMALESFQQARAIREGYQITCNDTLQKDNLTELSKIYTMEATIFLKLKKYEKVIESYQKVLLIKEANGVSKNLSQVHLNMAQSFDKLGLYDKAIVSYQLALETCEKSDKLLCSQTLQGLGKVYAKTGNYLQAAEQLQASIVLEKEVNGPTGFNLSRSIHNLAIIHRKNGDYQRAHPLFEEALIIIVHNSGDLSEESAQIMLDIGKNYCDMKMFDEATKFIIDAGRIILSSKNQSILSMQKDVQKWLKRVVKGKRKQSVKAK